MAKLPAARQSPRIQAGVLCWYEGDTFTLRIQFSLHDQDGTAVSIGASDTLSVQFYNEAHEPVHTFSLTGVQNNQAALTFDDTVSAKFGRGLYHYDIRYVHGEKTTLVRGNRAMVE